MTRADIEELLSIVERFIAGPDRSLAMAGEIEGLVIECFRDEPWFEDVAAALASYRPAGGAQYVDERALLSELASLASTLRSALDQPE